MSYTRLLYHIVFRTKYNIPAIDIHWEEELYRYIWGLVKNKESILYRIGGMPDHLHLLVELSPKLSPADFVRELKTSSGRMLKGNLHFPLFAGWGTGYAAFTYNLKEKDTITRYIMNQKTHHASVKLADELRSLLLENGCVIKEDYFMKDD